MTIIHENIANKSKYAVYLILLVVIYFVFFHRLGSFPIRTWDESVYAVYSYEMVESGNYLVPHINGQIDYLNDKPPFFFWAQIVSAKFFGYNEFSVRFPSALFGALTVVMLFWFFMKRFSFFFGLSVALVLLCSKGFIGFHSARTGDMDTMLAFGLTASTLTFILYLENQKNKWLILYIVSILFSFFTKSIAAFFVVPAHVTFLLIKHRYLLKTVKLWIGAASVIVAVIAYLFIRNEVEPGYFNVHFSGYLGKFKSHFNDSHNKPFDFYFNNLFYDRYSNFILFIIPAVLLAWHENSPEIKQLAWVVIFSVVSYLAVICVSPTKCYWYDVPLYPMFAVLVGYSIWKISDLIQMQVPHAPAINVLLLCFIPAIYYSIKRSYNNEIPQMERKIEVVHDFFHNGKFKFDRIKVIDDNYITPLLFYKYKLKAHNMDVHVTAVNDLQAGDLVVTGHDSIKNLIKNKFNSEEVFIHKQAIVYKIK